MNKIKVKMIGTGEENNPFTVDLPTWKMIGNPDYKNMTCDIILPTDEIYFDGIKWKIDQNRIKSKYRNWKNKDLSNVETSQ